MDKQPVVKSTMYIEENTITQVDDKILFYGYKTISELVNQLLDEWLENPTQKRKSD